MIKNYIKIAFRNILRYKANSAFNILGLSLGIVCTLLLTLHIKEELSYDKVFPKYDRLYRMVSTEWAKSAPPLAAELKGFFPEIGATTRFVQRGTNVVNTSFDTQSEIDGLYTDSSAVQMFDLKTVSGNPFQALKEPSSVVLNKSMSVRLFGNKNPIGQKLVFEDEEELWVKAVIEDLPENTHLKFDYLVSMPTFYAFAAKALPGWTDNKGWMFGWTYILLNQPTDIEKINTRLKDFYLKYLDGLTGKEEALSFAQSARIQPITDIHLKSDLIQEMSPNGNIIYIYIFIAVEVLILLIACVNFINLFTVQAIKRLKEIGIRKIVGAEKRQISLQFLIQAFVLTFLSVMVALAIYQIAIPFYNDLTGRVISFQEIFKKENLLIILLIACFVGFVSGLFPSIFASSFLPIKALKATKDPKTSAIYVRKSLVIFQFVISGLLITCTLLIYQQMQLFKNKDLGFTKDQVIVAKFYGKFKRRLESSADLLKNEFLKNPDILTMARTSNIIGDGLSIEQIWPTNNPEEKEYGPVKVIRVDENYLTALNIKLKEGRNFSRSFNDSTSFLLNEKAVEALELQDPINESLTNHIMNKRGNVVGVIENYNFESLHHQIEPLVLEYNPQQTTNIFIKIKGDKTVKTIDFIRAKIKEISPGTLFSYSFLDEKIGRLYQKESNMGSVLFAFTTLGIIISCLGLLGLIAYASEMRTKEIGIRKIIGASIKNLVSLLSKDILLLVLTGNLIAWPLSWYLINKWLENFAYKITIPWWIFGSSMLMTLSIALFTVIWHCLKTAMANPVNALRGE